ncbi:MAG TPA: tripartite tricarboxylate transporter substrate-binding protein [Candidatus Binatia bacterium]|nr:tripartite tricarboxylate transporter substrate-binding protein [Candidatus Binatia bacterium]
MKRRWILSFLVSFSLVLFMVSPARSQAPYYDGKTITILIGTAGGGSIVAARIIAQYLGKYIPGNPTVIVQPMLGGAHIVASNHVFNTAKPDGLTLLAANPNIAVAQLIKVDGVRFDVSKYEWIGSSGADGVVLTVRSDLPYKTFDDLRKADRELVVGSTGPGSNAHDFPLMLKEFAGAKFRFVSGYPANSDVLLAIERKEVDIWAAFAATVRPVVQRGTVRPLVRARVPTPGFDNLPVDEDLTTNPVGKAIMGIKGAPLAIGRAVAAPPATPADRVALLREALAKVLKDPGLEADGKKAQIDFDHIPGDQVLKAISAILQQPPEVQKEMVKYIKFGG